MTEARVVGLPSYDATVLFCVGAEGAQFLMYPRGNCWVLGGTDDWARRALLSSYIFTLFHLAVNPKKDSENTPVKGGTVADLGKKNTKFFLMP